MIYLIVFVVGALTFVMITSSVDAASITGVINDVTAITKKNIVKIL